MDKQQVLVSVYCLAYNHEMYIRDALEGFVKQKTTFRYEVIVHDDASEDKTPNIIKEYAEKYPDIFNIILQKENKYSQGIGIGKNYIYPQIRGKYVAVCEGDDFWCDENKLQKQVDFLEKNLNYSACTHATLYVNCKTNKKYINHKEKRDCECNIEDILKWKNKAFHTSSVMFRSEYFFYPEQFSINKVGDYPRAIFLALKGKIYFYKDVMSVYRMYTNESWSSIYENGIPDKIEELNMQVIRMLENVDLYTNKRYYQIIEQTKKQRMYEIKLAQREFSILVKNYSDILKQRSLLEQIYVNMNAYFPRIMKIYYKIKSKIK